MSLQQFQGHTQLLWLARLPDPVLQPRPEYWPYNALAEVFGINIWSSSSEEVDDDDELLCKSIVCSAALLDEVIFSV